MPITSRRSGTGDSKEEIRHYSILSALEAAGKFLKGKWRTGVCGLKAVISNSPIRGRQAPGRSSISYLFLVRRIREYEQSENYK